MKWELPKLMFVGNIVLVACKNSSMLSSEILTLQPDLPAGFILQLIKEESGIQMVTDCSWSIAKWKKSMSISITSTIYFLETL